MMRWLAYKERELIPSFGTSRVKCKLRIAAAANPKAKYPARCLLFAHFC